MPEILNTEGTAMTPIRFDRNYPLDQVEMDQITTIEDCSNLIYLGGRKGGFDPAGHYALPLYIFMDRGYLKQRHDDTYVPGPAFTEMDAHGLKDAAIYYAATVNLRETLDAICPS